MSDRDVVEEIRSRADIVDIVSEYVSLKRSGAAFKGLCPFHVEKTPSFSVNQARQIFHCFGCGAGGDVFAFLQRHEGLTFPEVLQILGDRYGVSIPRRTAHADEGRERALRLLEEAHAWFRDRFPGSPAADYVAERGVDEATVKTFGLGYAPDGWQNLTGYLQKRGFREEELKVSGVVSVGKGGRLFDTFRSRLIFPITDVHGRILAFGGRILGSGEPKYLNSPETPLFQKGKVLYGLSLARESIRREGVVFLVEGYMDVIACHRHGLGCAVAPLGTALTEQHATLVKRFTDSVCLIFDSDPAGIRAASRALPLLLSRELDVRVLVLPEGDDPDTCLLREGPEGFRTRVQSGAVPVVDFLLDNALEGTETRRARRALEVVRLIPTPLERSQAIRRLAERLDVGEAALLEELRRLDGRPVPRGRDGSEPDAEQSGTGQGAPPREELFLFALSLREGDYAARLADELGEDEFTSAPLRSLFGKLKRLLAGGHPLEYASFQREGLSSAEEELLTAAYSLDIVEEAEEGAYADCIALVRRRRDQSRIKGLRERVKSGDREAMKELIEIERRWKTSDGENSP